MAFYQFLALFPSLLVFLAVSSRVPHFGDHVNAIFAELTGQVLPDQVSQALMTAIGGSAINNSGAPTTGRAD